MPLLNPESEFAENNTGQRDVLLAISEEFALVQEKKHLVALLENRLKSFLGFSESTIFMVNSDFTYIHDFLTRNNQDSGKNSFVKDIKLGKIPVDDRVLWGELLDSAPLLVDFDELTETRKTLPYLKPGTDSQFREVALFNIKKGPETVGSWIIAYSNQSERARPEITLLQFVANLINTAVLHITANEQLLKVMKENEIIQAINADLSATKERADLLKIIHNKLKSLFDFGHHFVAILNDDDLTMTSFLRDSESLSRNHPRYNQVNITKYPLLDGFFNKAILSTGPVVFDLTLIRAKKDLPEYLQINYEHGVRNVIMTVLKVREKTIGVWAICQTEYHVISARQLELIRTLSVQFSIAIANIRANDLIGARDQEQKLLLELSYALTSVKHKRDLLQTVSKHLSQIFRFKEITIMLLKDESHYYCYLNSMEDQLSTEEIPEPYQGYFAVTDECFSKVIEGTGTVQQDVNMLAGRNNCPRYIKNEMARGIREKVGIALHDDQRRIGVLFINNTREGYYSDHELQLIQGISYQLSTAIANILSYEKISRREAERDTLISLSSHIAGIRTNQELLNVISSNLKSVIGFRHIVIARLSEDSQSVFGFLMDPNAINRDHPEFRYCSTHPHAVQDGFFDKAIAADGPLVFDLERCASTQTLPLYIRINFECGIKQAIVVRLKKNDHVYGFWMIYFDHNESPSPALLRLISGIASQLSVAIQNVMANKDTEQKGEEKSRLITFSNTIITVRDQLSLARAVKSQLKDLFSISDCILLLSGSENGSFIPYLFDADAAWIARAADEGLINKPVTVGDSLLKELLLAKDPLSFTMAELNNNWPEAKLLALYDGTVQSRLLLTPVYSGRQLVGLLTIWTDQDREIYAHRDFFKGICAQIAIVIDNISASEKIKLQLEEISGYRARLEEEKIYLQEELDTTHNYTEIIGESSEMKKIFRLVNQVSASNSTVMILGETGTGKELIARAIHNNSPRKNKLMVKVNCAALPANLIESELFGHEKGSFTGATERRLGKFELANNGTLFLDEIGEMPLELQVKLLRALQEKEIERIGGNAAIKVDVRIIAATNRDLEKEMSEGRFRSDLYYRLNIFPISLPALRNRPEDIPLLASHFIHRFSKKAGKNINGLSNKLLQELRAYSWPGNIRELEHLIERSILMTSGDTLKSIVLPVSRSDASPAGNDDPSFIHKTIDENEREHILNTLRICGGRINGNGNAAQILGVPPSTLSSKMKRLGIRREHIGLG